jgi:lipid II isoglutaminyl synthase (glutamine-hydrolysing)
VTVTARPTRRELPRRAAVAAEAVKASNWLSRALGRGSGTVAGGRVGLALDGRLLAILAESRPVALVTGTNGKTTTTRMLVAALAGGDARPIASNQTGANMPAGHVAALVGSPADATAVLEVDEGYLGRVMAETRPRVVVLLNLSRDQLDRISEVRMLSERWREALGSTDRPAAGAVPAVVANADDPLVVHAAAAAPAVVWVGAGQVWRNDAVGCPVCEGRIAFEGSGWACERCGFSRPQPDAQVEGSVLVLADGSRHSLDIGLPGQFNRSNAAVAAVAAALADGHRNGDSGWAGAVSGALDRLAGLTEVAGRFSSVPRRDHEVRMLLAKNPAGWAAVFDLLDEDAPASAPAVLSINARTADGLDTSWLWDVPFERLGDRSVVATGDRHLDLAVRLHYAGVPHDVVADPVAAVDRAIDRAVERAVDDAPGDAGRRRTGPAIDFLGNYTAFAEARARL